MDAFVDLLANEGVRHILERFAEGNEPFRMKRPVDVSLVKTYTHGDSIKIEAMYKPFLAKTFPISEILRTSRDYEDVYRTIGEQVFWHYRLRPRTEPEDHIELGEN